MDNSRLRRITNALFLNSYQIKDIGLLNGKSGIALYFYYLSRFSGKGIYKDFAETLLNDVVEELSSIRLPLNFQYGITGIGWTFELLNKEDFIEADMDEILDEIDILVGEGIGGYDPSLQVIVGIMFYYLSRLTPQDRKRSEQKKLGLEQNALLAFQFLEQLYDHTKEKQSSDFLQVLICIVYITSKLSILPLFEKKAKPFFQKIIKEIISLSYYRNVDSLQSFFLRLMLPGFKLSEADISMTEGLSSPLLNNGIAGLLQIIRISDYKDLPEIKVLREKLLQQLKTFEEYNTPYAGYNLNAVPEIFCWGLWNGISGVGLSLLLSFD